MTPKKTDMLKSIKKIVAQLATKEDLTEIRVDLTEIRVEMAATKKDLAKFQAATKEDIAKSQAARAFVKKCVNDI